MKVEKGRGRGRDRDRERDRERDSIEKEREREKESFISSALRANVWIFILLTISNELNIMTDTEFSIIIIYMRWSVTSEHTPDKK